MFDTSYSFKFVMTQKVESEPYFSVHRFTFRCKKGRRYTVLLEEYPYNFFSIKFYLQSFEQAANKYSMLTRHYDAPAVINTCLIIMAEILAKHKEASFGFTGALLDTEVQGSPSKRYRIYKRIMENLFSPERFVHYQLPEKNAYFLINKKSENPQHLLDGITTMLQQHYEF